MHHPGRLDGWHEPQNGEVHIRALQRQALLCYPDRQAWLRAPIADFRTTPRPKWRPRVIQELRPVPADQSIPYGDSIGAKRLERQSATTFFRDMEVMQTSATDKAARFDRPGHLLFTSSFSPDSGGF